MEVLGFQPANSEIPEINENVNVSAMVQFASDVLARRKSRLRKNSRMVSYFRWELQLEELEQFLHGMKQHAMVWKNLFEVMDIL